jgi:hypothetical protein
MGFLQRRIACNTVKGLFIRFVLMLLKMTDWQCPSLQYTFTKVSWTYDYYKSHLTGLKSSFRISPAVTVLQTLLAG